MKLNQIINSLSDFTPQNPGETNIIQIEGINTPLGIMYAASTSKGICLLEFEDYKTLKDELKFLQKKYNAGIRKGKSNHIKMLESQLKEYFKRERKIFEIPIQTPGTDFQQSVWELLKSIPYGSTSSYKEQAAKIGKPGAFRAVASANGKNRIAILIPCHRIIGSDGSLTGYSGGLARKKWLLEHEMRFKQMHLRLPKQE